MIFPGSLYCTGVLSTYIKSYYHVEPDSNIVNDLLPLCLFLNMFFMPWGSYLVQNNVNPRLLILMGGVVGISCFVIASFFNTFIGYAIFYAVGFSFNQGIVYMVPVHHGWLWFPDKPGLISGIILGGFGFGSLIFDNVLTHLINPGNEKYDEDTGQYPEDVNERFKETWYVLIASWAVIAIVGIGMTFPGPEKKK